MLYGRLVHEAIDAFYSKISQYPDSRPRPIEIETVARQAFADKVLAEMPTLHQRCEKHLKNFIAFENLRLQTWKQYKPTFTERSLGDGFLYGRLDAYWEADGVCVDWKTGGSGEITEDMIRQNAIYRALLTFSNFPVRRVLFVMLDYGVAREAPQTTKAWLDQQIENYRNGKIFPNRGPHCAWCQHIIRCEFQEVNLWQF